MIIGRDLENHRFQISEGFGKAGHTHSEILNRKRVGFTNAADSFSGYNGDLNT
jgi:hypothetical protein